MSIVGIPLSLRSEAQISKNTTNEALSGCYPELQEDDVLKNNRKNNVSKSSLSQYLMCFPNAAGIHGALYWVWWYEPPYGVQK